MGKGIELPIMEDIALRFADSPATHRIPPSREHLSPNQTAMAASVEYSESGDPAARVAWYDDQVEHGYCGPEQPGYHGYYERAVALDVRTARRLGHEDVYGRAVLWLRGKVALELLCEDVDGHAILPGARRGDPWGGGLGGPLDALRSLLRGNTPRRGYPQEPSWVMFDDLLGTGELEVLTVSRDDLPRLRSPMTVTRYEHGFSAVIPAFRGRIEGGPWWAVVVDNRRPWVDGRATVDQPRVVDSVSWRDLGLTWKQTAHANLTDAIKPRFVRGESRLGTLREVVEVSDSMPIPPLPSEAPTREVTPVLRLGGRDTPYGALIREIETIDNPAKREAVRLAAEKYRRSVDVV